MTISDLAKEVIELARIIKKCDYSSESNNLYKINRNNSIIKPFDDISSKNDLYRSVVRMATYFGTTTNNKSFAWKHVFSDCDTIQKVHSGVNEMYGRQVKYMIYGDYYYYYIPETRNLYNLRIKSDLSSYEQITDVEFRDFVYYDAQSRMI